MNEPDPFQWELSKENVMPKKGGRNVEELNKALANTNNLEWQRELKMKQSEFEVELRTYTGDDPLDSYFRYTKWMEEMYPSGCSALRELYQITVNQFIDDPRYKNDSRYVDIWIKFITHCHEPIEKFDQMFYKAIGTMTSSFYCAWADRFIKTCNWAAALEILEHAIMAKAQPVAMVEDKLTAVKNTIKLEDSSGQPPTSGGPSHVPALAFVPEADDDEVEGARVRLGQLRTTGPHKEAPIIRVGPALLPTQSGNSQASSQSADLNVRPPPPLNLGNKRGLSIFRSDAPVPSGLIYSRSGASDTAVHPSLQPAQENLKKPTIWTDAKLKPSDVVSTASAEVTKKKEFDIFVDESTAGATSSSSNSNKPSSSSSARLGASKKPSIPDYSADGVQYMCNMKKIYGGLKEVSIEMIRAGIWVSTHSTIPNSSDDVNQ